MKKDNNINIRNLVDKYWNSDTTLREELELHKIMEEKMDEKMDDFETESILFRYYSHERQQVYNKEFTLKDIQHIKDQDKANKGLSNIFVSNRNWIGLAASLLLILSLWGVFNSNNAIEAHANIMVINNPEEAEAYMEQVFGLIDNTVDKQNQLFEGMSHFDELNVIDY